jgi:predicted Holliday junction resolvase-like endonuclease
MIFIIILAIVIFALLLIIAKVIEGYHNHMVELTEQWRVERSELLDRIQSPSFAEYKSAEVRMVKAQKDEEPKPSFILE